MDDNGNTTFDPADMFTRMWGDFASRITQAGSGFDPQNITPESTRKVRDSFITALNQHAQQFMRSPEFLAMLKQQLDASISVRKQINDFLAQMQHEFQSVSRQDADQVMEQLQHLETRITTGMDRLARQIDRLDARLDALESHRKTAAARSAKTTSKAAKSRRGKS